MDIDVFTLSAIASGVSGSVFKAILANRSMVLKDILKTLSIKGTAPKQEDIEKAIKSLEEKALIKESQAPIADFNTYYVTADGLEAGRVIRKLNLARDDA